MLSFPKTMSLYEGSTQKSWEEMAQIISRLGNVRKQFDIEIIVVPSM